MELLPLEARLYEPRLALDGGPDGLDVVQRIIAEARQWLAPDGQLLVETSRSQASAVVATLECHEMAGRIVTSDELDATAVIGWRRRPGSPDNHSEAGH
jgi:release factor glutamine methyltransferase